MNGRGSGEHHYDLSRCREAYELHRRGMIYKDIARHLGVNANRAKIMADTWEYHKLELEAIEDLRAYRNS